MRVLQTTLELPAGPDGRGEEAYAAAAVIMYDRVARRVTSRSEVQTKEYGELVSAALFPNRIQGGSMTANGGIWTGNGVETIPSQYNPTGSSLPALTNDRFPILVWEGSLTSGVDALLLAPSVWERDIDPNVYRLWSNNWRTAALDNLFATALTIQLTSTQLSVAPMSSPGLPIILPVGDLTGNVKDRPVGMAPQPPVGPPITATYQDRYLVITREKLAELTQVGASKLFQVDFVEPITIATRGSYTLFIRIERTS
jgi:hypothetical protein